MERKWRLRSILAFMLTFAVVLGMVPLPGMTKEAQAADVTSDSTTWNEDMTVNENMTIESRVTVIGDVTLTLSEGKTLIAKKGITVTNGNSLTITGTGTLFAGTTEDGTTTSCDSGCAGIGGGSGDQSGNITINGGIITAFGNNGAGIGGGTQGAGGSTTITGGTVTAKSAYGAGIGGGNGSPGSSGLITITGGNVIATGGSQSAGIGGGWSSDNEGGVINISGGTVTATGGVWAAGIGGGNNGGGNNSSSGVNNVSITISGSAVITATGGSDAAGIGGGWNCSGGSNITISGGTITATGNNNAAGIGSGDGFSDSETTVSVTGNTTMSANNMKKMVVSSGKTLTVPSGGTLGVTGTLTNNGTVTNNGTMNVGSSATLTNNGTVTNSGTMTVASGGTVEVAENATLTVSSTGSLTNNGSVTVAEGGKAEVKNDGTFYGTRPTGSGTINGFSTLIIKAKDKTITYGDAPGNDGVTYSGFVDGDTKADLTGTLSYTYTYSRYGDIGTSYKITPGGLTSDKYNIKFVPGTLTVEKKEIGLSWSDTQLIYNGESQAPTASATGLVNGDSVGVTVTGGQVNAGNNYTATASGLTGDKSGNYKLPSANTREFSIKKIDPVVNAPMARSGLKYSGSAQALVTAGTVTGGTMYYAVTTENTAPEDETLYSVSVPEKTDVRTYYVWYKIKGDTNHYDAVGEGSIAVSITKADHAAATTDEVEVAAGELSERKVSLDSYLENGASLVSYDKEGALSSKISGVEFNGKNLVFEVADTADNGERGTIILTMSSTNYDNYAITVPVRVEAKSTKFVFGKDAEVDSFVTGVSSSNLSDFTGAQTETAVKVVLDVKVKKAENVDSTVKTKIESELDKVFSDVESTNVKKEFLDMKVTKSVNGGSAETVEDVGRVLEIEVSYDLTGKYNPVIIREHKGLVARLTELSTKPTGSYKDGTFSVDRTNNKIYIYTEFFSTYSIAYADTPSYQVTFDNDGTKTQVVVKSGGKVTKPADPTKSGYTFNGWYNGSTAWNFDNDTVSSDLTLTARWTQNGGGSGSGGSGNGGGSGSGGNGGGSDGGTSAPTKTTPGKPAAPGSTETPDAGKKPAAKGTVLVDAGKMATYVVTSADAKHPTIAYKKCRNKKAKTVTIPKTVKIGGVTYTVTSIAANAFKNYKTLTKVTIGDSIKTIGKNAFYGCKKLKTVTIGKNVTKIGKKAFYGCGKLKKITVKTKKLTLKNVGKSAFSGIYIRASVLVPGDKRKEYALLFRKRGAGKKIKRKTK